MKTDSGGVANESGNVKNVTGVLEHEIRTCPACGTKFSATGAAGVCPVCMFRGAVGGESASSKAPDTASAQEHGFEQREPTSVSRRFENYELMVDERGTPIELGRGAMGITYKAFDDPALLIGAYGALANTLCYLGNFEAARQSAMCGVEIWRSGGMKFPVEEILTPPVCCLIFGAYSEWFLGEIAACQANMAEAISLAKDLKDMNALAVTLYFAGILAFYQRNPVEAERLASQLIELSARYNFAFWLPGANVLRGWARSVSGDTSEGISGIERGVEDYRASGSIAGMPLWLAVKAEALNLADRSAEALEAIGEAEAIAERFEIGCLYPELKRLRGVSLAALGADETRVEASFRAAIKIAREQKAVSLEKRAEANYAEYRARKGAAET